jgi:hypothetical protein
MENPMLQANATAPILEFPPATAASELGSARAWLRRAIEVRDRVRALRELAERRVWASGGRGATTLIRLLSAEHRQEDCVRVAERRWQMARIAADPGWAEQKDTLRQELLAEYGHLGPVYTLLVDLLVHAEIKHRQLDQAGLEVSAEEWRCWTRQVREVVGALQHYTEHQTVRKMIAQARVEAAALVLEILDPIVGEEAPQLWARGVRAVEQRFREGARR